MISPKTRPRRTTVTSKPGTIWDGITEYRRCSPVQGWQVSYLLRMYGDGTRRFSEFSATAVPRTRTARSDGRNRDGRQIGVILYVGPMLDITCKRWISRLRWHADSLEPVNQTFYTNNFRAHAARYAQHLNATLGFDVHSRQRTSGNDWSSNKLLSALLGSAQRSYNTWDEDDPYGTDRPAVQLRRDVQVEAVRAALQGHSRQRCVGSASLTYTRRNSYFEADLAAFKSLWRQGIIYSSNHDTTPWSPKIFDVLQIRQTKQSRSTTTSLTPTTIISFGTMPR